MGVKASISGIEKVLKPRMDVSVESDDDSGSFDLNKMRSEISAETNNNSVKLGDIMGSSNAVGDNYTREEANLPDGEELLQRNKFDCGSSKPTDIDG